VVWNRRLEADLKVIWKLIWAGKLHWSRVLSGFIDAGAQAS
jgi:hypothetical protein